MAQIEQVHVAASYAEALLIQARLDEEGLPYLLQAFNDPAFGSFWRKNEGWGVVLAPVEHRDRILEICGDIRNASQSVDGPPTHLPPGAPEDTNGQV